MIQHDNKNIKKLKIDFLDTNNSQLITMTIKIILIINKDNDDNNTNANNSKFRLILYTVTKIARNTSK